MGKLVEDLLPTVDELRGLADDLGLRHYAIDAVKKTWEGTEPGDGDFTEEAFTISPVPKIEDLSLDKRVLPGGPIQQGDIMISKISKVKYEKADIDGGALQKNEEFFWRINGQYYRVVTVTEGLTDWQIQVRRTVE